MNEINENLKKSCEEAVVALQKLNIEETSEIKSKLEWCIGSYEFDKNPAGLHEMGLKSLAMLKEIKQKQPKKVTKKVIDGLEKSIQYYSQN